MSNEHPLKQFAYCPRCGSAEFMVNDEMVSDEFSSNDEYDMKGNVDAIYFVSNDKGDQQE